MQISKLFLPLSAAAVISLSAPLHAQDSATQAQMREALRQKINELNTPQAPAAPAAPVAPEAPVVVAPEPPPVPAAPVVVVTPAAVPVVSTESAVFVAPAAPMDDAAAARAREALRQKMLELDTQSAAATTTATPGVTFTPAAAPVATVATATAGYRPIEVPASPLTGTKEARLATLLQQYKADQITPEQYHTQRAAIIAEP